MANAIEMAIQAAIGKLMERAPDMLGDIVKNLPPDIVASVGQINQTVLSFKGQLDRIENQQRIILAALKIPDDAAFTTETQNVRLSE